MTLLAEQPVDRAQPRARGLSLLVRVWNSVAFWWVVCLSCAAIFAIATRHDMNPDGLSYLDMAGEALRSGPSALVNGLWSPGYPAILSIALALFHPSPAWELPLAHFVNFLIFALDLWAFHFFLRSWLSFTKTEHRTVVPFGYCMFLLFTLQDGGIGNLHPDLAAAAVMFLATGLACRGSWAMLGLVLGVGYYVKGPLLPLGLILLASLILFPPAGRESRKKLFIALGVFLLAATPLVTLLSLRSGHLSVGDSGKLNYAWHVNGLQEYAGWIGSDIAQPPSSIGTDGLNPSPSSVTHIFGVPVHPPRMLMEKPMILEFGSPVKGTFPLWYDPAYWYEGAKAHFSLRQQIGALKESLSAYETMFSQRMALLAGAIVLLILGSRLPEFSAWLWITPVAALLMFALVHVEIRYIAVFCIVLCVVAYGALASRVSHQVATAVCTTVAAAMLIPFALHMARITVNVARDLRHPVRPKYQQVADGLRNLGVHTGDRLAVVGFPFDPYYAHFLGARVVATIPATGDFSDPKVTDRLRTAGVKAIIARNKPAGSSQTEWRDIGAYSVLVLSD